MAGPDPRCLLALRRTLQLSVAAMCCGVAWRALQYGDVVSSYLFLDVDWSEDAALLVARTAGCLLIGAAVTMQWRRGWPVLLFVAVWLALLAALTMTQQPPNYGLVPASQAVRFVAPLALAALLSAPPGESPARVSAAVVALRLAVAATFVGHGLQALAHEPAFLDYLFVLGERFGPELDPALAERLLDGIGAIDLVAAVALLVPLRPVCGAAAAYMALWGLGTAAIRTGHSGPANLLETLLRIPNGGVPLALLLYWLLRDRPEK